MSRYSASNPEGEQFSYGFDGPLREYFMQKDAPETEEGCIELVGSLSKTYGSSGNLLTAIEEHKVQIPEEHRTAMMLDMVF